MKKIFLVSGLMLLIVSAMAKGEISVTASLEWLADNCIDSAVYTVTDIVEKKKLQNGYTVSLKLKESFRGQPSEIIKVTYYKVGKEKHPIVEKNDEFLVCFQHNRNGNKQPVQIINLDKPQQGGYKFIAVSTDLKLMKKKENILKIFKDRIKKNPKRDPVLISDYSKDNRYELIPFTKVWRAIYGGSSCYIRVPKDLIEKVELQSKLEIEGTTEIKDKKDFKD